MIYIISLLLLGVVCDTKDQIQKITADQNQMFFIHQPSNMERLKRKSIVSASEIIKCQTFNNQVYTNIQSQYRLKNADSMLQSGWKQQIVTASCYLEECYLMLSSGKMIHLKKDTQTGILSQSRRYLQRNATKQWFQAKLIVIGENILCLWERKLIKVEFANDEWIFGRIIAENVIKVQLTKQGYFIMTQNQITYFNKDIQQIDSLLLNNTNVFIDMAYGVIQQLDNLLYVLTPQQLMVLEMAYQNNNLSLRIKVKFYHKQIVYARRLRIEGNRLLIHFQRHFQNIIGQFTLTDDMKLLEGWKHKQFDRVRELFILGGYGVVDSHFQFSIFEFSSHSDSPVDNQISFKYDSIVELIPLNSNLKMLLVLPYSVELITLKNYNTNLSLMEGYLGCTITQRGKYEMSIQYQGICKDKTQCQVSLDYSITISQSKAHSLFMVFDLVVIMTWIVLTILCGIIFFKKRKLYSIQILDHEQKISKVRKNDKEMSHFVGQNID